MDPLLHELSARGALDGTAIDWVRARQKESGDTVGSILLELELVDEDTLLQALESWSGLPAITSEDLALAHPEVGARLPPGFSRSFGFCPLRFAGNELVVVVESPLSDEAAGELRELFGLAVRQLIATAHHLTLAWRQVYGTSVDESTRELETRLAQRRRAEVRQSLETIAKSTGDLRRAAAEVLDFAACLVDFSCFLITEGQGVLVAGALGAPRDGAIRIDVPDESSALVAAIRHGGYFAGPLAGNDADCHFYAQLMRSLPRYAFVAPVPTRDRTRVAFYADNGSRGMASRRLAELTLLVARLGQCEGDWEAAAYEVRPGSRTSVQAPADGTAADTNGDAHDGLRVASTPAERALEGDTAAPETSARAEASFADAPIDASCPPPTTSEREVLDRLRQAAAEAGMSLGTFVDHLLAERRKAADESTAELVGEVKGLFEKLAADIPTQLARGMESAFREMVPRVGQTPPAQQPEGHAPARAAQADLLVQKEAGPREVPSYRSRRRKAERVKL